MTQDELDDVRKRYVQIFGDEGAAPDACRQIEERLAVRLPNDFKAISEFFSGGLLGGVSLHATHTRGPATNITQETERLRTAVCIPRPMVVLAEPPEGLIVLQTAEDERVRTRVVWCSEAAIGRLNEPLVDADTWPDYFSFFQHLLTLEEEERGEA